MNNERGEVTHYSHSEMIELARMALADVSYGAKDDGDIYAIKILRQIFPRLLLLELRYLVSIARELAP